jgi:hypothetical protein
MFFAYFFSPVIYTPRKRLAMTRKDAKAYRKITSNSALFAELPSN